MALKVGELFASANIDTSGFTKGISAMSAKVLSFKKTALMAFGAVSAAVGAGIYKSVNQFSDYEDALTTATTKTTDAKNESEEFGETQDKLDKKFKQLGEETRFTMQEIAAAGTALGQTGYDAEETSAALGGVVDVASASGEALPMVSERLSNVAKGLGKDASYLGRLGDIFAEASRSSNVTVKQLSESMKYFAPIADSMDWSTEKATALMGVMGDMGIQAGQAGRQFKSVMADWQKLQAGMVSPKKMDVMKDVLAELGIDFEKFNKQVKSGDIEFVDFLKTLGQAEQPVAVISEMFTKLASAPLTKLAEDGGAGWKELTQHLKGSKNAAGEMAEAQEDTLAGATDILQGSLSKLQVAVGEKVGPALQDFMEDVLIKMVNNFSEWVEEIDSLRDALESLGQMAFSEEDWEALKTLGKILGEIASIWAEGMSDQLDVWISFFQSLGALLEGDWGRTGDKLKETFMELGEMYANLFKNIAEATGLDKLVDRIKNVIDTIKALINKIPFVSLNEEGDVTSGEGESTGGTTAKFAQETSNQLKKMLKQVWQMPTNKLQQQLSNLPDVLTHAAEQAGKFPIPKQALEQERATLLEGLLPSLEGKLQPKTSTETRVDFTVGENVTVEERRSIEELNRAIQRAYENWERRQGNK